MTLAPTSHFIWWLLQCDAPGQSGDGLGEEAVQLARQAAVQERPAATHSPYNRPGEPRERHRMRTAAATPGPVSCMTLVGAR